MRDLISQFTDDLLLIDRKAIFALVYAAAGLSAIYYLKDASLPRTVLDGTFLEPVGSAIAYGGGSNLPALAYWVAVVSVFYFVIPALAIKFLFRERLRNYGLNTKIERGFWKLFALSAAAILPLVYWMSLTSGFAAKYPFLKIFSDEPYIGPTLLAWELIYFIQFFGLEFFFRGFLVHSLKPALGIYSIFAMTVPYCMIHFGKPPAETFAAILAGIFLGWLSFRNGNIWLGLLLHCTVALSMDILALLNKGMLL